MPEIKFTNNAISILNGALTNVATTINVAIGEGAKFPTLAAGDWFYATLEEVAPAAPAFPLREIVKVTARSSDALTVTRGQDGTTARAWLSSDKIELRWTAATVADLRAETAALDALKVSKAGDTMTGNLNVPSMNGGPLAGFRNKVINGAFDVWQRGAGPFTTANKSADMWNLSWDGTGGTRSVSRVTHDAGVEIEGQLWYLRWTQTAAGTATWNTLEAILEYARTLNGKQATLSFWAQSDANRSITILARQLFGTGGSGTVDTTSGTINIVPGWNKYTWTFTMPSVSGKTIGTDNKLALIFMLPLTAFTMDLTNVQLEAGPVGTPFETRPYGLELGLCYRYYWRLGPYGASMPFFNGACLATTSATGVAYHPTKMRALPVLSTTGTPGDYSVYSSAVIVCNALPNIVQGTVDYSSVQFPVSSGLVNGYAAILRSYGTATGFLGFSAEL